MLNDEARVFARSAEWILAGTEARGGFPTTREAIADCDFVIGTSVRTRGSSLPFLTPREAARRIAAEAGRGARVAVLFGNERTGLTGADLELAHACVCIPTQTVGTERTPTSLNLSHALAIVCYELYHESLGAEHTERLSTDHRRPDTILDTHGRELLVEELMGALRATLISDAEGPGAGQGAGSPDAGAEDWTVSLERVWLSAMQRLLSVGTLERKDAKVLFNLARRTAAVGRLSRAHEGELPLARYSRLDLQRRVDAGEFGDGALPTRAQVRLHMNERLGIGLTKREVEAVLRSLVPPPARAQQ